MSQIIREENKKLHTARVSAKKFFFTLCALIIIFSFLHLVFQYIRHQLGNPYFFGLIDVFDMDQGKSIPTWFASTLFFIAALLAGLIYKLSKNASEKFYKAWAVISAICFFIAIDEVAEIHNLMGVPAANITGLNSGIFYFSWIIPGLIIVLLISLSLLRFWLSLPKKTKRMIFVSAFMFLLGAIGVEMAAGYYITNIGGFDFGYAIFVIFEEGLEKLGVSIFIYSLILYLKENYNKVSLDFGS
jgi:hypothetical protein